MNINLLKITQLRPPYYAIRSYANLGWFTNRFFVANWETIDCQEESDKERKKADVVFKIHFLVVKWANFIFLENTEISANVNDAPIHPNTCTCVCTVWEQKKIG
ncbi:793_t:CDS:2 [Ambispora leptoticha]|uniref:793_t:CDS:1 n=1 Tax=Ambispora leptoticha TaxID=144679 RepID=A0A9N8ZQ86_9GLOM|nr:793_t:CDS:2 [Ambispora leptoticha]